MEETKRNKSPEEFLMGNRSLKPLPVAMDSTTEVYLHGTQLFMSTIGCLIGILNSLFIVIPVIYPLKLTSIHEKLYFFLFNYMNTFYGYFVTLPFSQLPISTLVRPTMTTTTTSFCSNAIL
ncbi:hypothetical protein Anas_14267 [Armadillidium nasatum]|uniref:Uncharacterized protein n=1 Tax=Armadillidium nasatum TaxID=96803 RepID=A0A5N5THX2_9CRUS|nr:hypothetical protein Anas_14267 [Armadillidium nasatum]